MKSKEFIDSFLNFLDDSEGLTREDLIWELRERGIDTDLLQARVAAIVKKASEEARLSWVKRAQEKRIGIEELLKSRDIANDALRVKNRIKQVLSGNYGLQALSYAEAYFRKKEDLIEKDLETLLQDLEDLNLLEEMGKEKKED